MHKALHITAALFFVAAVILHDMHVIDLYFVCTKDGLFILAVATFLLLAIAPNTVLKRAHYLYPLLIVFLYPLETLLAPILPDTLVSTQEALFSGEPVLEVVYVLLALYSLTVAVERQALTRHDAAKLMIGFSMLLISGRVWIMGENYLQTHPEQAWNMNSGYETRLLFEGKEFPGREWVIDKTDYQTTAANIALLHQTPGDLYWLGPVQGQEYPGVFRARKEDNRVYLDLQKRDMEWGNGMIWIPHFYLSFILVGVETFILSLFLLGLPYRKQQQKRGMRHD